MIFCCFYIIFEIIQTPARNMGNKKGKKKGEKREKKGRKKGEKRKKKVRKKRKKKGIKKEEKGNKKEKRKDHKETIGLARFAGSLVANEVGSRILKKLNPFFLRNNNKQKIYLKH